MWTMITVGMLCLELILVLIFVIGRVRKKKVHENFVFLGLVFAVNLTLHIVPYVYDVVELGKETNLILSLMDRFFDTIKLFLGTIKTANVADFAHDIPLFTYAYFLGVMLAVLATISAAVEAFSHTIRNRIRLRRAMTASDCDIVVGTGSKALKYAKTCNAVVLIGDSADKEVSVALMEDGYVVMRRNLSAELLKSRYFHKDTRYNVVCPQDEKNLEYIDTFISYKNSEVDEGNIFLYVEIDDDKAKTIRREIIEKSGFEAWMTTFSSEEMLARAFVGRHPITKYMPRDYIEDGCVKPDTRINVFVLGFGKRNRELYRQSVLNNQLVTYEDGQYKTLPLHYYLYDTGIEKGEWAIEGLQATLAELDPSRYFPLPELPYITKVIDKSPVSYEALVDIKKRIMLKNRYSIVIIDTGDDCRNIEAGVKLKTMLSGYDSFRLFVRSDVSYTENDDKTIYFGRSQSLYTHDIIVDDRLSAKARKLHEMYTAFSNKPQGDMDEWRKMIKKKAEESWNRLDYFTLYSNIHSAMNLRLKLNLLGLDYEKAENQSDVSLLEERYPRKESYAYEEYFEKTVRNSLLAQEHARWTTYHLLAEYLPLEKEAIVLKEGGNRPQFVVKNAACKKHACLTTYSGLHDLSSYLASKAGEGYTAADYEFYIHDEMLLSSASEVLKANRKTVVELNAM